MKENEKQKDVSTMKKGKSRVSKLVKKSLM